MPVADPDGFGIQVQNSMVQLFNGSSVIGTANVPVAPWYSVDIDVAGNIASVWVNGILIPDSSGSTNFALPEAASNYVSFSSHAPAGGLADRAWIDDFEFSVPAALAPSFDLALLETFNAPDTADPNAFLAGRQSGQRSPAAIIVRGAAESVSEIKNQGLRLMVPAAAKTNFISAGPDLDLGSIDLRGGVSVTADIRPSLGAGARWTGLKLRGARPGSLFTETDGTGIYFREDGSMELRNGGRMVPVSLPAAASAYRVQAVIQQDALTVFVNGSRMIFDRATPAYPLGAANGPNFVSLVLAASGPEAASALFDNLQLEVLGPIPDIVPLRIVPDGSNMKLFWPALHYDYVLQRKASLLDAWQDLGIPTEPSGDEVFVTDPAAGNSQFYRLRSP